jgi:hypothetical protein
LDFGGPTASALSQTRYRGGVAELRLGLRWADRKCGLADTGPSNHLGQAPGHNVEDQAVDRHRPDPRVGSQPGDLGADRGLEVRERTE